MRVESFFAREDFDGLANFIEWLDLAGQDWIEDAECADADPDLFFSATGRKLEAARSICRDCLVQEECLAYATDHQLEGCWGGTTRRERQAAGAHAS